MEHQVKPCAETPEADRESGLWLLPLLFLCVWQVWLTLSLFASAEPSAGFTAQVRQAWDRLCDDDPIVSGRHPLHLYFGYLGSQALREHGSCCCYETGFQAGFPKTPVFDSGSRPAELFLLLGGGSYRPAAYKLGLALCCLLMPGLLALAAWGLGLGRGFSCLAVALGLLIAWGSPGRAALEDGDLDLLLASLAGLAYLCSLLRYDRSPGLGSWLALWFTGVLGWFAHPVIFILLFPLMLLYYLSVGAKHPLNWHLALLASLAGALAVNSFWLTDWVKFWWIRLPLQLGAEPLRHRTLHTVWNASLWGGAADRALTAGLLGLALVGVCLLNQSRQRAAARLLGLGAGGFLALAIGGIVAQPLGRLGAAQLLLPALWFAVLPAVHALACCRRGIDRLTGWAGSSALLGLALLAAAYHVEPRFFASWTQRCSRAVPLTLGLGPDRRALVDLLRLHTDTQARILWEDRTGQLAAPRWSALLPLLTERAYLGGLDPHASIEHAYASFIDHNLAGRPVADWSDAELDDFCRRYNVGWVVCWSPAATARFRAWLKGEEPLAVHDEGTGYLFTLQPKSFILKGQARWLGASRQRIALADVVPEDGKVVLSMHYQAGLQASPARVQIEREPDPFDPIPFIRLRIPGPVARVTLTWEDR